MSLDQTTRVHAPWNMQSSDNQEELSDGKNKGRQDKTWHEIARPQVHGHDLSCITMIPGQRMASGAEEKIIRTFEATTLFLNNLTGISKVNREEMDIENKIYARGKNEEQPQGASVPSLGLSNKPILYNDENEYVSRAPEDQRHVKDMFPDFYFTPESHSTPPPEESLVQNTL